MKNYIELAEDGVFVNLKSVRDTLYGEKQHAYDTPALLGIERIDRLMFVENSDGFWEVANQNKCELCGVIYKFNKWKKLVWQQHPEAIMTEDCLETVKNIINSLKTNKEKKE